MNKKETELSDNEIFKVTALENFYFRFINFSRILAFIGVIIFSYCWKIFEPGPGSQKTLPFYGMLYVGAPLVCQFLFMQFGVREDIIKIQKRREWARKSQNLEKQ